MGARVNSAVRYSSASTTPPSAVAAKAKVRSKRLAVAGSDTGSTRSVASRSAPGVGSSKVTITSNSGDRAGSRAGCTSSTSRSNG